MKTMDIADAQHDLPCQVKAVRLGEFVTITDGGKPVAVLVSVSAAEKIRTPEKPHRASFAAFLRTFPGPDVAFARDEGS